MPAKMSSSHAPLASCWPARPAAAIVQAATGRSRHVRGLPAGGAASGRRRRSEVQSGVFCNCHRVPNPPNMWGGSFLDPIFDGESEFQRVGSSKCDPPYDMSVKRPKRAIMGRLTYKFQYGFVNCWRVVVWVAFLTYILEICRKKLQQLRHLELFQNRNERKSTKKSSRMRRTK